MKNILINIKVNAGGPDVKGQINRPFSESLMEGATRLGRGSNIPKLGEARYSDIGPGIDNLLEVAG